MAGPTSVLSTLTPITTTATALGNVVLVSPQKTIGYQPLNTPTANGLIAKQPPALLFNYEGEQTVSVESDITDHYIEDNTAIQDQISIKPTIITTHGFIGELNDVAPGVLAAVQAIANKLVAIGAYTPALSATAILAYDEAFQLYQVGANVVQSAVSAWGALTGTQGETVIGGGNFLPTNILPNQNKQQYFFQQFFAYQQNRILFNVQTPWAVFQNMAIQRLRGIQDAETNQITDFEISFKQIKIASTQSLTQTQAALVQGQLLAQSAPVTNLGTSTPTQSPTSFNDAISGSID